MMPMEDPSYSSFPERLEGLGAFRREEATETRHVIAGAALWCHWRYHWWPLTEQPGSSAWVLASSGGFFYEC